MNDTWKWLEKDLTLITIPDAGHWVHHEAAELVNRSLMAWLSRQRDQDPDPRRRSGLRGRTP